MKKMEKTTTIGDIEYLHNTKDDVYVVFYSMFRRKKKCGYGYKRGTKQEVIDYMQKEHGIIIDQNSYFTTVLDDE